MGIYTQEQFDDAWEELNQAYQIAALWSSTDAEGEPLDSEERELTDELTQQFRDDTESFLRANYVTILIDTKAGVRREGSSRWARAGHDFWLSRCGHGAGFWDGDWEYGETLTEASEAFGTVDLYVTDDNLIGGM